MDYIFDSKKLKETVDASGFRTDYIASNLGIKPESLRAIINGKHRPSITLIKLMAIFFKVDESYFVKKAA